jgi:hypothetical protein
MAELRSIFSASSASYGYRIAEQIFRECVAWTKGQLVALLVAILSAWAALHWGLVPTEQTRAAYMAYLVPFLAALGGYLIVQVGRAPYILDMNRQERIKALEEERNDLAKHFKASKRSIVASIGEISWVPTNDSHYVFVVVDVKIRNLGPNTAIHNWNARHRSAAGANTWLADGLFDTTKRRPDGRNGGNNLIDDEDVIVTGGIRSGWVSFRMSYADQEAIFKARNIHKDLDLSFEDAFGVRHRVTMFPDETE